MRQFTPEHRAKLRAAHLGKPLSPEHREAKAAAMRRPEVRAKLSKAGRGNKSSQGRVLTLETRQRISVAKIAAYDRDPSLRQRIAAANRAANERDPSLREIHAAALRAAYERDPSLRAKAAAYVVNAPVLGECIYCFGPAQTMDHVIPRGRPGWDDPANLLPACYSCNSSKNDRTPDEWLATGVVS